MGEWIGVSVIDELVEDHPDRIDICSIVDDGGGELLRRHICRCPNGHPDLSHLMAFTFSLRRSRSELSPGDAKVEDPKLELPPPLTQEEVLWLKVSMHNPLLMRFGEP